MAGMSVVEGLARVPEARYSYYRRCQVFRRNGEQCKAPAEKGSHICYAHAGQQAMAFRRDLERRVVLAEAVAEMRRQGHTECELENLLMDFKGIQVTLAVMSRAIIGGRIDCKTAGRLVVHLQTMSKLLWMFHRKEREGRKGKQISPQICADERRLSAANRTIVRMVQTASTAAIACSIARNVKLAAFPDYRQGCRDGPWLQVRAA